MSGLINVLTDDQPAVRERAAWALGAIGDRGAEDALLALLEDSDVDVRRTAVWALSAVL